MKGTGPGFRVSRATMPRSFEETDAWKTARKLAKTVYGLCDQLRRAAISVMNNIAEGWESLHAAEKKQAYNYARRSCGEVRSMSYVLLDNQFVTADEHSALLRHCVQAGQLASGLIRSVDPR